MSGFPNKYSRPTYKKPVRDWKKTLTFVIIGAAFIIGIDYLRTNNVRMPPNQMAVISPHTDKKDLSGTVTVMTPVIDRRIPEVIPEETPADLSYWEGDENVLSDQDSQGDKRTSDHPVYEGAPKVVIIIDDMGVDRKRSFAVMDLPAPLTLAFLPYAPKLDSITSLAREKGHELLMHMPMEAMNADVSLGGMGLTTAMEGDFFEARLTEILDSFHGYVGVNNHMGSKLTQDKAAMTRVMAALKARGLLFVDSKTIHTSVAADIAAAHGLPHISRDVFLDHEDGIDYVYRALGRLERTARANGVAVAIGHPKDSTIAALKVWIPMATKKGFDIVPVKKVVGG